MTHPLKRNAKEDDGKTIEIATYCDFCKLSWMPIVNRIQKSHFIANLHLYLKSIAYLSSIKVAQIVPLLLKKQCCMNATAQVYAPRQY